MEHQCSTIYFLEFEGLFFVMIYLKKIFYHLLLILDHRTRIHLYILLDIFNSLPTEESKKISETHFKTIKLDEMLTMNRQTGFYEMVNLMITKNIKGD